MPITKTDCPANGLGHLRISREVVVRPSRTGIGIEVRRRTA
jgi:hypothetical protein